MHTVYPFKGTDEERRSISFNAIIDESTETDHRREAAYNYAANCVILEDDHLGSRLQRSSKILNKYKHKG